MERLIKNSNGSEYYILEKKKDYTLLQNTKTGEYVVALNLKEYEKGYCWDAGSYFMNLINAKACFDGK